MIAQRWGYSSAAEADARTIGQQDSKIIVHKTFVEKEKRDNAAKGPAKVPGSGPRDDEQLDSCKAYKAKTGKWTVDTVKAIHNGWFWVALGLSYLIEQPWGHLLNFLQKKTCTRTWWADYGRRATHLSVLVVSKAEELAQKWEDRLSEDFWRPLIADWTTQLAGDNSEEERLHVMAKINCAIATLVATSVAEFAGRILARTKSWPLLLMILCESPSTCPCARRQSLAKHIVAGTCRTS